MLPRPPFGRARSAIGLKAARGVEVIAGPDHAYGGGGGLAVVAAQVVADGVDEPLRLRAGRARAARGGRPSPVRLTAKSRYQRVICSVLASSSCARRRPVAVRRRPSRSPQVEHGVAGEAQADDTGDQAGDLGERDGLGAALGEIAAERVVEASRGRRGAQPPRRPAPARRARPRRSARCRSGRRPRGSRRCRRRPPPAPCRARRRRRAARTAARPRGSPRRRARRPRSAPARSAIPRARGC